MIAPAEMAAAGVDEIDRHRGADVDDAHGASRAMPVSPMAATKRSTPSRQVADTLWSRRPDAAVVTTNCGATPSTRRAARTQAPLEPLATDTRDDDAFHAARAAQKLVRKILRAPTGMCRGALPLQTAIREARPFDARIADVNEQDVHANGLTLTSPATNLRTPCGALHQQRAASHQCRAQARACAHRRLEPSPSGRASASAMPPLLHEDAQPVALEMQKSSDARRQSPARRWHCATAAASPAAARSAAATPARADRCAMSAAPRATLRPMPMTAQAGPAASARSSIRMPPSLASPSRTSFGHLSCRSGTPEPAERAQHAHADRKAERADIARHLRESPAQRQAHRAARRRKPGASAPAAARALKLRQRHIASRRAAAGRARAARCWSRSPSRRLRDDAGATRSAARQRLADERRIQRLAGTGQAIAAIAHGMHRRAQIAQRSAPPSKRRCG